LPAVAGGRLKPARGRYPPRVPRPAIAGGIPAARAAVRCRRRAEAQPAARAGARHSPHRGRLCALRSSRARGLRRTPRDHDHRRGERSSVSNAARARARTHADLPRPKPRRSTCAPIWPSRNGHWPGPHHHTPEPAGTGHPISSWRSSKPSDYADPHATCAATTSRPSRQVGIIPRSA
jgi:hypothetical protein